MKKTNSGIAAQSRHRWFNPSAGIDILLIEKVATIFFISVLSPYVNLGTLLFTHFKKINPCKTKGVNRLRTLKEDMYNYSQIFFNTPTVTRVVDKSDWTLPILSVSSCRNFRTYTGC